MASYIALSLVEGEDLLASARISMWPYAHWVAIGGALLLSPVLTGIGMLAFLGAAILATLFMIYESTELAITTRRVVVKRGVMSRSTSELYLNRVEGVEVEQTITGRMLNYGTVNVRGVGDQVATVRNIANPMLFRNSFFMAADKRGSGAGLGEKDGDSL